MQTKEKRNLNVCVCVCNADKRKKKSCVCVCNADKGEKKSQHVCVCVCVCVECRQTKAYLTVLAVNEINTRVRPRDMDIPTSSLQ